MRCVIVNHACNANAVSLKQRFAPLLPTRLIDSGTPQIEAHWRDAFDECLPNVYYGGLFNRAGAQAAELVAAGQPLAPMVMVCSDVEVDDAAAFVDRLRSAFAQPAVEVWAPSSTGSGHPQMWPEPGAGLRRVSFVEGFCFAARARTWAELCPVDQSVNRLGWGYDVALGVLAARRGGHSVVDTRLEVRHPRSTGYDTRAASTERHAWFDRMPAAARLYRTLATVPGFRSGAGCALLGLVGRAVGPGPLVALRP